MSNLALGNLWAWAVQVAAIAAIGLVLPVLVRITSPGARLTYLRGLLLACLILPAIQPWVPLQVSATLDAGVSQQVGLSAIDATGGTSLADAPKTPAVPSVPTWPWSLEETILGLAIGGTLARFAWLGLGFLSLGRLRRRSRALEPMPEPVEDARLAIGASAEVLVSATVARPVTFGFRRPVVIVPESFLDLAPDEQRTIAMHELLHVRRRDWPRTLADEVVRGVLWFHPAIWWLIDQIHLGIEQVVDREVVRLSGARRPYLDALLKIAATQSVPALHPASMFLKQRHLAQRVASLVREVAMSRVRLAASLTMVGVLLATSGYFVVQAFPLRTVVERSVPPEPSGTIAATADARPTQSAGPQTKPVVDPKLQAPRPGMATPVPPPPPPKVDEPTLRARIQANPTDIPAYFSLARLLENQGRPAEAEQVLLNARAVDPSPARSLVQLAGYYNRQGDFEKCVDALKERFTLEPANPEAPYTIATYYWDKAYRDKTLGELERREYVTAGLAAVDDALRLKPEYVEGLTYKNLLLRLKATMEPDPAAEQALVAEADRYRDQALEIRRKSGVPAPPNAVRIGGDIRPPRKIKDVRPEYPAAAADANVQGVVILEILVNEDGKVGATKVLRSIPLLDAAAMTAVRQWEFEPVSINGQLIPAIMTVTVNFTGAGADTAGAPPPPPPPPPPSKRAESSTEAVRAARAAAETAAKADPWYPPEVTRVGGDIQPPRKTLDVRAVYPQEARDARVQGVVIVEAVVGTDGKVSKARVLRSIPMLDQAALDAVQQWEFTPTVLNGMLVPVVMTVTVNFTLR